MPFPSEVMEVAKRACRAWLVLAVIAVVCLTGCSPLPTGLVANRDGLYSYEDPCGVLIWSAKIVVDATGEVVATYNVGDGIPSSTLVLSPEAAGWSFTRDLPTNALIGIDVRVGNSRNRVVDGSIGVILDEIPQSMAQAAVDAEGDVPRPVNDVIKSILNSGTCNRY